MGGPEPERVTMTSYPYPPPKSHAVCQEVMRTWRVVVALTFRAVLISSPQANASPVAKQEPHTSDSFVRGLLEFVTGRFFRLKNFGKNETDSQIWFASINRTIHRVHGCHPCHNRYTVCSPWWMHTTTEFLIPVYAIPDLVQPMLSDSLEPFSCGMAPQYETIPVHNRLKRRFVQVRARTLLFCAVSG